MSCSLQNVWNQNIILSLHSVSPPEYIIRITLDFYLIQVNKFVCFFCLISVSIFRVSLFLKLLWSWIYLGNIKTYLHFVSFLNETAQVVEILFLGREWVIRFLSGDNGQRGPYSPYKPCNHSLYTGIYRPQFTLRKKILKKKHKNVRATIKITCHWRWQLYISL